MCVLWKFGDSSSVVRFLSGTAFKCSLLQRSWSHLQWMVSKVLNNWVLFSAGVGFYFHTAVSIPAVGPIQWSVGRCRGKGRIWLLNYALPCSPYITQHCHHQVEIFVNWLIVASAAFGPAAEPGSHQCEEGELQFRLFLCISTRHQRLVHFMHRNVVAQRNYRCHWRFTDHTSDLQIPRCMSTNITLHFCK
jgi:hypothetical protein